MRGNSQDCTSIYVPTCVCTHIHKHKPSRRSWEAKGTLEPSGAIGGQEAPPFEPPWREHPCLYLDARLLASGAVGKCVTFLANQCMALCHIASENECSMEPGIRDTEQGHEALIAWPFVVPGFQTKQTKTKKQNQTNITKTVSSQRN